MRTRIIAVAALLSVSHAALSQSVGRQVEGDVRNVGKDILSIWGSPFDAKGRDWLLAGAAFTTFGVSMLADQSVSDWAIRNDNSAMFRAISPLRRGGKAFSGKYVVPPIAAVYVLGVALQNQDLRDFVTGCGASWAAQSFLRKGVYMLVGRARPDSMPNDPNHWTFPGKSQWMMHSFPAGHFANVMACATYWNKRFRLGPAGPVVYGLAAAVGAGRLADKGHWFSDTVLGGVLGYAVGNEVAHRSLVRHAERRNSVLNSAQLYMSPDLTGMTMGVRWTF